MQEKHEEVALRMVGHQVLLNAGDSTSRVLPIRYVDGSYIIEFESEFSIVPDELVSTVNRVVRDTKMSTGYFLEVKDCERQLVVYSYEVSDTNNIEIIPCKERALPNGCYQLYFTLYNAFDIAVPKEKSRGNNYFIYFGLFGFVFAIIWYFIIRKRGTQKEANNPNLISLGKYQFDKIKSELILKEQRIELTGKEAELLLLLYQSVNETVERDTILQEVWGDEGDYVGRTLDVFISKLRKKLEGDSNVKIANIRGVGYKLVMTNES